MDGHPMTKTATTPGVLDGDEPSRVANDRVVTHRARCTVHLNRVATEKRQGGKKRGGEKERDYLTQHHTYIECFATIFSSKCSKSF